MKPTLERLLRIRELIEDLALADFEEKNAGMRGLQAAAERQRQMGQAIRAGAVRDLTLHGAEGQESWLMNRIDSEIAGRAESRLRAGAEELKLEVDRAREGLLERRLERRQVETLHAAAVEADEKRRVRLDQNRTDDWFQSQSGERNQRNK